MQEAVDALLPGTAGTKPLALEPILPAKVLTTPWKSASASGAPRKDENMSP